MGEPEQSTETDSIDPASRRVGMTLSGKWKLEKLLGVGGMAAVYAGRHRNGARAAIKYFSLSVGAGRDLCKRFMREGYLANRIEHPSVVRVLDDHIDLEREHAYIVMELLEGESLQEHLERVGLLSPKRAAELMSELCACLAVAHEAGVVHRDIKPDNLFIDKSGLRVLDFGIARALDSSEGAVTRTGAAVGTPAYMAPEQAMGKKEVSPRTDIYSVGATLLYLLTGAYLHDVDNAQEMLVNVAWTQAQPVRTRFERLPEDIARVIDRACAFKPEDRYGSAEELKAALDAIAAELPDVPLARISRRSAEFSAAPTIAAKRGAAVGPASELSDSSAGSDDERLPTTAAPAVTPREAESSPAASAPLAPRAPDTTPASMAGAAAQPQRGKLVIYALGALLLVGAIAGWWFQRSEEPPSGVREQPATTVGPQPVAAGSPAGPEILPAPPAQETTASEQPEPREAVTSGQARPAVRGVRPSGAPVLAPSVKPPNSPAPSAAAPAPKPDKIAPGVKPKERDLGY
jgi:serine/threonine-protein kinase